MAQTTILADKFYEIRKLMIDLKYRTNRTNSVPIQSKEHLYLRQKRRRLEKQALMRSDPRFAEFFAWVFSLQKRLGATDKQFATLCEVSTQTLKLWRNYNKGCGGTFPSTKTFRILMRLEVVCQARIKVKKNETNIKNKRFPKSRVKIPTLGRKRLQANVPY
jgi:hypothetical protein